MLAVSQASLNYEIKIPASLVFPIICLLIDMEQVHVGSACSDSSSGVEVSMDSSGAIPVKAGENTMPIAIIGMSCRFPGDATSPEKLWKLCAESRSAWSQVPSERFNQKAFYHPQAENLGTVSDAAYPISTYTD